MNAGFNPNNAAYEDSGIFGLPYTQEESSLILNAIPWEATASYGTGCSHAPQAIIAASKYIELCIPEYGKFYEKGIFADFSHTTVSQLNKTARKLAEPIIQKGGFLSTNEKLIKDSRKVSTLSRELNSYIHHITTNIIVSGKISGIIGGDHSVALGSISAHVEKYPEMSVLQLDAHCDLRKEFETFVYSHASIMWNVLQETQLKKLIQVGVRAFCEDEYEVVQSSEGRVTTFFDGDMLSDLASGKSWDSICNAIVSSLSDQVYISCDIDGLEPSLCPNTGTPVPGGLSYNNLLYLLKKIHESEKTVIGFDLVEVTPSSKAGTEDWNAIVGAHLLYQLCGLSLSR
jgi:agmatinase